jgi:predicted nucleic acid-binding protein
LNGFVLDASVALRWFLDHPMPPFANRVKQHLLKGARAVVPALWHFEMSNGLVVAQRRSILTAADVDQAVIDLELFVAQAVDTETSVVSARQSLATARAFQLSAYAAVYLNLARNQRLTLATLDDRLRAAATQAGVSLLR